MDAPARLAHPFGHVMSGAYLGKKPQEIAATRELLEWFRAFIRSGAAEARDPYDRWVGSRMTRVQAQARLRWLINVAINRKAGVPDATYDAPMWRDARAVRDRIERRVRVHAFETRRFRERFGHLVSDRNED